MQCMWGMCSRELWLTFLWYIKAWGARYVHIAEVNRIIEKYMGVWSMADSELYLEASG